MHIEELRCEELRQSILAEGLEVTDRLLTHSERIFHEFLFLLRIFDFESRNCVKSLEITELIEQF